jgi:hypothetical protein
MIILAQIFASSLLIVEEKLLGQYYLDPLKVVGFEGLWGLLIWCILLPIFQQIPCSSKDLCPYGVLEDSTQAFKDFGNHHVLIGLSVAICFSIALFNAFGVSVTKNASAAQRSTIDTSRTVIIWIFFLIVPFNDKREEFSVLQLFGFIFLVFGTLVFNEILILPFLGFDQSTKVAIARKKESEEKGLLDSAH